MEQELKLNYFYNKQKKIVLREGDLKVLLFIFDQALLSQDQVFTFYKIATDYVSDASFRRKMSKWAEAGIIKKTKRNIVNGFQLALIQITSKGLTLLKEVGLISKESVLRYAATTNLDHTLAIKQTILEWIYVGYSNKNKYYISNLNKIKISFCVEEQLDININGSVTYMNSEGFVDGNSYTFFSTYDNDLSATMQILDNDILYNSLLKPDLILSYDKKIQFFEIDIGTEKIGQYNAYNNTVIGKLDRYNEINHIRDFDVVFLVLDERRSVRTIREYPNRNKRIANIKQKISQGILKEQREIYILPFSSISEYLRFHQKDVLNFQFSRNKSLVGKIKNLLENQQEQYKELYTLEQYKEVNVRTFELPNYTPQLILHSEKGDNLVFLYMREGNMRDYDTLHYFSEKMLRGVFGLEAKIVMVYVTENSLKSDVVMDRTKNLYDGVLHVSLERLFS